MPRKRKKQPELKNDFAAELLPEAKCAFEESPVIEGKCISSFSFNEDNPIEESNSKDTIKATNESSISTTNTAHDINQSKSQDEASANVVTNNITPDYDTSNSIFPSLISALGNGASPSINGEIPSIKRTYILRDSSIRKLNEIKSIHPNLTVCISTIVDLAIEHYYNHIIEEADKKS